MSKISSEMLHQTLNVISMARENALHQGKDQEANTIAPVEDRLRSIVTESTSEDNKPGLTSELKGSEFQYLLNKTNEKITPTPRGFDQDKNRVIQSMSMGGMTLVEIARQMGMTTEEVAIVAQLGRRSGK
jgi:hypothetical protein